MGLIVGSGGLYIGASGGGSVPVKRFEAEAEYIFQKSGGSNAISDGTAKFLSMKGRSLVWNQLLLPINSTYWQVQGTGTVVFDNGEATITLSADAVAQYSAYIGERYLTQFYANNKYYVAFDFYLSKGSSIILDTNGAFPTKTFSGAMTGTWNRASSFFSASGTNKKNILIYPTERTSNYLSGDFYKIRKFILIDLTLMFGAGNEPSTVEEFETLYHLPYYDHNPGEIISNKTQSLVVTGFNQWDEEMLFNKGLSNTGGVVNANGYQVTSFIPVISGKEYYLKSPKNPTFVCWYNAAKEFLFSAGWGGANASRIIPDEANFVRFQFTGYGTTYNHDICINISDPARNGQYEPYKTNTIELNLPTLTGKLNGEGESVVVFPDGMKSVRDAYDSIVGSVATKKIYRIVFDGTETFWTFFGESTIKTGNIFNTYPVPLLKRISGASISAIRGNGNSNLFGLTTPASGIATNGTWDITDASNWGITFNKNLVPSLAESTDVNDWKAWLAAQYAAGHPLTIEYELAKPEEYILDTPLPKKYKVWSGGTEERLPRDTSSSVNAPVRYDVLYPEPED